MTIARILKHWILKPVSVSYVIPQSTMDAISTTIAEVENTTSAEFQVVIERSLPIRFILENGSTADRAQAIFSQYRCWDTEDNNGVMIYLNLTDHAIEIAVDRAASRVLDQAFLDNVVAQMGLSFKTKDFEGGICRAIRTIGAALSAKFPNKPVDNPLPNDPILI